MSTLVHLTPFEEKLIQVIDAFIFRDDAPVLQEPFLPTELCRLGDQLLEPGWSGRSVPGTTGVNYPLLNRFLGRLENKGIVAREPNALLCPLGSTWCWWRLTDTGITYLGSNS